MTVRVLMRQSEDLNWNRRIMRWAEYLLLFVGLIALDYYIWVSLDTTFYQAYESWSFDREVKGMPVSVSKFVVAELGLNSPEPAASGSDDGTRAPDGEASSTSTLPGDARPERQTGNADRMQPAQSKKAEPQNVIGRILVPRLQLSAMVREGIGDETLRRAVGHIPSSALPGQLGNVALAGHRDTFFRKLRDIRKTDKIVMSTLKGDYDYLVESVKIVAPQDVSVLRAIPGEQVLTLVTCFPFNYVGSAPKRFIVRAKQVDPTQAKSSTQPQSGF